VRNSTTCRLKRYGLRNGAVLGVCHFPLDGVTEIGKVISSLDSAGDDAACDGFLVSTNIDSVTVVIIAQLDLIATPGNEATDICTSVTIPEGNGDISARVPQRRPAIVSFDLNSCVLGSTLSDKGITDLHIAVSGRISSSGSCSGHGDSEQRDCAEDQREYEEEGYDFFHFGTPFF